MTLNYTNLWTSFQNDYSESLQRLPGRVLLIPSGLCKEIYCRITISAAPTVIFPASSPVIFYSTLSFRQPAQPASIENRWPRVNFHFETMTQHISWCANWASLLQLQYVYWHALLLFHSWNLAKVKHLERLPYPGYVWPKMRLTSEQRIESTHLGRQSHSSHWQLSSFSGAQPSSLAQLHSHYAQVLASLPM